VSLYHDKPNAFRIDDEAIAHTLAPHASIAVATSRREARLARAMDARKEVDQATGILMERHNLTSDQASGVLRRYSQDTNTKLHDVARQVITSRATHGTDLTRPGRPRQEPRKLPAAPAAS
jgi:hypothetical protein